MQPFYNPTILNMGDDPIHVLNSRQPQFFQNKRRPPFFSKWKTNKRPLKKT
jgi:hypothetical protein